MSFDPNRRKPGTLLPPPTPAEVSKCERYFIDIDKYRDGILEPITVPEEFKPESMEWEPKYNQELINTTPKAIEGRNEYMASRRPEKAQLQKDMETMTNSEIARHYKVAASTVTYWISSYQLKREKPAPVPEPVEVVEKQEAEIKEEPVCTRQCEVVVEINELPTREQVEEFFVDTMESEEPGVDEIWDLVREGLELLRATYIRKAEEEFEERFKELLESLDGGDEAC